MRILTGMCIVKGKELKKDAMESLSDSFTTDKELAFYDKIFIAHQDAEGHIRDDLVRAVSTKDVRVELTLLDRAVSSILLQRAIERNLVLGFRSQSTSGKGAARNILKRKERILQSEKI